jgi:RND family efflux transporter MFP subunit
MRLAVLIVVAACSNPPAGGSGSAAAGSDAETTVPVTTASVVRTDVPVIVSGPGRTDSLEKLQIRAPFDGVLLNLTVTDGDYVKQNQTIGWIVSRDSQAALAGSQAMLRAASTPQERRDAQRALQLAKRSVVKTPLRAPEDGIVFSHQVDEGARVALNEQIVLIVAADSIVFLAQVAQNDLARVRSGNPAQIVLAAQAKTPMNGVVRSILPSGSATDLTAPVRVDFDSALPKQLNLYGVAQITVGVHRGALVVPATAVIRDDVNGISRVALVDTTGHAHWVEVKPGLALGDRVELLSPPFGEGARVVTAGQVGLPDGARVQESNASS